MKGAFQMLDGEKKTLLLKETFHCSFKFVVFYILHLFADQMLEFVCGFFLHASFVIYISITMDEIMWVRVNYKVMSV
jgi:hypothetical protein